VLVLNIFKTLKRWTWYNKFPRLLNWTTWEIEIEARNHWGLLERETGEMVWGEYMTGTKKRKGRIQRKERKTEKRERSRRKKKRMGHRWMPSGGGGVAGCRNTTLTPCRAYQAYFKHGVNGSSLKVALLEVLQLQLGIRCPCNAISRAGIAQSVKQLATGWTAKGSEWAVP
jgi:hypothetical protein